MENINIVNYIPKGKKNAVTRAQLRIATGLSDRKVRDAIADARRHTPIINDQSGRGYYIPTAEELPEARKCLEQERRRAKSIFWSMKALRAFVEGKSNV